MPSLARPRGTGHRYSAGWTSGGTSSRRPGQLSLLGLGVLLEMVSFHLNMVFMYNIDFMQL